MIVRRFMNWLRMTVAASLGGTRRRSLNQNVREPVLVGVSSREEATDHMPPVLSLSNWLDNGRRLRPRLRLASRELGSAPTRPLRYKTQPAASPMSGEPPTPRPAPAPVISAPAEAPRIIPAIHMANGQNDDLSDLGQLDAETRRLMLLRHLVRQRVFNEGFTGDAIPKQYHRSLGLETPPTDA